MVKLFGKHYGTERFFIMLFACFLVLTSLFIYGGKLTADANKGQLSSTALYTTNYVWSRTSGTGQVVSLLRDRTGSKVFMLIKNDGYTSLNADDYEVFYTNYDKTQARANSPALTIYSYGSSGYVGFYFTDAKGFANQIVDIWIRNDSAASDMANENTFAQGVVNDQSFIDHNQIQILANFGASGMRVSNVFDGENVNQLKLFANTAGVLNDGTQVLTEYNSAVNEMERILGEMKQTQMEYLVSKENLEEAPMYIVVPDVPYTIAGDKIDTAPINFDEEPKMFSEDMIDNYNGATFLPSSTDESNTDSSDTTSGTTSDTTSASGPVGATYYDANGNIRTYNYYHVDTLPPGAVNLEYQGKLLSDGFITQTDFYKRMEKKDMIKAYEEYRAWKRTSEQLYGGTIPFSVKYDSWRRNDGSYVDMTDSDMLGAPKYINEYVNALNKYLSLKQQYYKHMDKILEIEYKIQLLGQNTTVFSGSYDEATGTQSKSIWVY